MFVGVKNGLIQSQLLHSDARVMHGFSTRVHGDMRGAASRRDVKNLLHASSYRLVAAEQVHGTKVHNVVPKDYGQTVTDVDGLVFDQRASNARVLLLVIAADCVPLLFADSKHRVVGACHAGWKGTLGGIAAKTVRSMEAHGAKAESIRVAIGPHICPSCYDVPEDRARDFQKAFPRIHVMRSDDGRLHVDLGLSNMLQLQEAGIHERNIDRGDMCTSEQRDALFSWRRERGKLSGQHMAIIGLR